MDCDAIARYVDLYLDGELAIEERAEVEAHLKTCGPCRAAATMEARFRTGLRQALLGLRAPGSLRQQVSRLMRDSQESTRPRFALTLGYAGAVVVMAVVGYAVVAAMWRSDDPADSAVAAHVASSDTEVYGDVAHVAAFLGKHAPFTFRVPIQDRDGVRLVGARVTALRDTPAVVYLYDVGDRRVSVTQYPYRPDSQDPGLKVDRRSGYTVATYRDHELMHTVVGDLPEPDVSHIIPASWGGR